MRDNAHNKERHHAQRSATDEQGSQKTQGGQISAQTNFARCGAAGNRHLRARSPQEKISAARGCARFSGFGLEAQNPFRQIERLMRVKVAVRGVSGHRNHAPCALMAVENRVLQNGRGVGVVSVTLRHRGVSRPDLLMVDRVARKTALRLGQFLHIGS